MSFIQRIIEALDARLWKFIRIVHSANHDYPYHDYVCIDNSLGDDPISGSYAVGTNNVNAHGDQSKRFVSKRTNIWSDHDGDIVRFNDSRNVGIVLPFKATNIDADIMIWEKEFHTNISVVHYTVGDGNILCMYFEGVLPEEARDAE